MKRYITFIIIIFFALLPSAADTGICHDESGNQWTFEYEANWDGEAGMYVPAKDSAIITDCSNYYEETTIPEKVKVNGFSITVKAIGGQRFQNIGGLKKIILPSTVTTICDNTFQNCSLESIDLSHVLYIGAYAFQNCELDSIDLSHVLSIGAYAFQECNKLREIGNPILTTITEGVFEGTNISSISFPNATTIMNDAFKNCKSLINITLPKIISIGCQNSNGVSYGGAFSGCDALRTITLPETIKELYPSNLENLESITINSSTPTFWYGGSFDSNTLIWVPKEAISSYKEQWASFASQILPIGAKIDYDIRTTAQDNAPGLLQQLDRNNLNSVVTLKVSGTINGYDIMLFRNKMDNLHHLDLSDADIVANPYEYYEGNCTQDSILGKHSFSELDKLISVKMPNSVKQINAAFNGCKNLTSVVLPEKLISLDGTFETCSKLENVEFKSCQNIKYRAFRDCSSLRSITLPSNLTNLDEDCFYLSGLDSVIIPNNVEEIGGSAFGWCGNLKYVSFPPSLKKINRFAFERCALDSVSLPGLVFIGDNAFANNSNLKELRVPSTLEKIEESAFTGCGLEKVYAYTVLPISISQGTFDNFSNISLYVPTQSVDNYYLNTQWSQFKEIHEFNEPYKYFYLDKEFTLEDKRFDGTPDIDIKEDGGLKVDGKDNQEAGDVTIKGDGDKGNSGTLITDGNLNAKKMRFDISVSDNKWYFFSFPFDIKLSDTKAPGEYKWKMYDGSIRADQGSGGWVNLPDNEEWLKQGKGYIFQTNKAGTLTLKVTKEKFGQLDANNIMKELDVFPSGNNFDASWNFIGNPQTSYYNVNDLGYEAPITVWNGNSYEAVRPGDDDYTLHPFQAFFVQKPTASSTIEFKAEDRLTKTGSEIRAQETKARRLARGFVPSRMIINLNVSDGSLSDKTRVVFNDKKSRNYEMDCDAAKFMTLTQAPQLYSVEGKGTKFAINERPMGSVQLGFTAKKSGTFTISAVRMDQPMLLKDNVAGITIDLTNGDYEFTSEAGTFNKRFLLTPNSSVTSIADVMKKTGVNILPTEEGIQINGCNGKNVDVYNLNGAQVASSNSDGMLRLSAGVYIVKVNGMSTKVMVK